jgi:hypothetical protein
LGDTLGDATGDALRDISTMFLLSWKMDSKILRVQKRKEMEGKTRASLKNGNSRGLILPPRILPPCFSFFLKIVENFEKVQKSLKKNGEGSEKPKGKILGSQ